MSRKTFVPRFICVSILAFALSACGGRAEAVPPSALPSSPAATPTVPSGHSPSPATPEPAIPETRRLTLEFPPKIRAGDSDIIRLTLEVDRLGNVTPTAVVSGDVVTGEVIEIPNLYETHHVIAEARFDIAGMEVSPPDLISQTLEQGQTITFRWSVRPPVQGLYRGTIWLYLRFVDKVSGEESQKAVSAQDVEIEAVNLFGFSGKVVRSIGAIGSVIGGIVGFPFFEDIVKYFFKKRRKRTK